MLGRLLRRAAVLLGPLLLAGCEGGYYGLGPGRPLLSSGLYEYQAWSDFDPRRAAWWGYLDLRVHPGGEISGSYRLPDQCADAFGFAADCVGYLGGRVEPDGAVRFGLDEGWLRNEGAVFRAGHADGRWETRLLGYRDRGLFELAPYRPSRLDRVRPARYPE